MRKHQWLSNIKKTAVLKKTRNVRRRLRRQSLTIESLEPRNLLASVSFDGGVGALTFDADMGQADIVSVSAPTTTSLQIQVGNDDAISLLGDAVGNDDFVLSQSTVANDTLTINVASSVINQLSFSLMDLGDVFTATGLAGIQDLLVEGGGGDDTLDASALTSSVRFFGNDGDDLLVGGSGTDVIDGGLGTDTNSFAGIGQPADINEFFPGFAGVTATITADGTGTAVFEGATENFSGIENLIGSSNNDHLTGNELVNVINGGLGNDSIFGLGGDDVLSGGPVIEVIDSGFSLFSGDQPLTSLITSQTPADLVTEAAAENLYVNVTTNDFSGGEIRGQFLLISDATVDGVRTLVLDASLDSAQVSTGASDSDATGSARVVITVDGSDVTYSASLNADGIRTAELLPGTEISAVQIRNASVGTDGPTIIDLVQDAGGDVNGNALTPEADTENGSVFGKILIIDGDIIEGGAGNDTLFGGTGNDTLIGGGGTDVIDGGAGFDEISFQGLEVGVTATLAADRTGTASYGDVNESFNGIERLIGSENDDVFTVTGSAPTTLRGEGGNDVLTGGDGKDLIIGGLGNDTISGRGGNDNLIGDSSGFGGEDSGFSVSLVDQSLASLTTSQSPAELVNEAVAGNLYIEVEPLFTRGDAIRGQFLLQSDSTVDGVRTLDLSASLDSEQVPNGASDSDATGQATVTIIVSGSNVTYSSDLSVDGIIAFDLVSFSDEFSAITIQNAPVGVDGPIITDVVQGAGGDTNGFVPAFSEADTGDGDVFVEATLGGNDIINGGAGNDFLSGDAGNDILRGGAGDDELLGDELGDAGDDILNGGAGNDMLRGGAGDDFFVGIGGTDSIDGGEGNDTNSFQGIGFDVTATVNADGSGTASYGAVNETFVGIENLTGSDNNDVLTVIGSFDSVLRGFGGDDILTGNAGNDVLVGNDGDDILRGGGGNDSAFGGEGNDALNGGAGNDTLQGNGGNDFFVGIAGVDTIDGGVGFDTNSFQGIGLGVTARINDDGSGTAEYGSVIESFVGIDRLVGSSNDDTLTATGSRNTQLIGLEGDDLLVGGLGDDVLVGGAGNDTLNARGGNDLIFGGLGNDTINAGDGDDFARGDEGDDSIAGGAGNDRLAGSEGNDKLFGSEGSDLLFGAAGDDELFGGDDEDELRGGDGDDLLIGGLAVDFLVGGAGEDREIQ